MNSEQSVAGYHNERLFCSGVMFVFQIFVV